ncbi:hypothetical protein CEUSTIGMA_g7491.t1 [Chlamydomonas eustigma]|uniref:Strawberry notch AAA domain-containing protein n=1 Tax=Chlamydomonas eustigma TaxID=1157962 RepID=A0A250XAZ9_9CHLO|nr:hypothetical protein CEUSTIGMA_g7491.t1 [Chlamydomonas eustigma]|eukprot:GAX80052.1 hypothetical protein CEUSTIGMA_g7491.t1 [Chlamydomonas eustigma]
MLMQHREQLQKQAHKLALKQAQKQHAAASKLAQANEEEDAEEFGDGLEEKSYSVVSTADLESLGLRKHPDAIAECASLNSVQAPKAAYKSRLPAHVLTNGISALQFESVRLACERHAQTLQDGSTAGFFLGDGPGVGKGRQVAAIILENFLHGRTKAIWISVSADLSIDAERDLRDSGALRYQEVKIHDLKRMKSKPTQALSTLPGLDTGVLFSTYDLLISGNATSKQKKKKKDASALEASKGPASMAKAEEEQVDEFGVGTRLKQIIDWFGQDYDGLIVLDECHRAKNCVANKTNSRGTTAESKTSRAVIELQQRCRKARILYVSATGATEAENLCYMTRLGLWGAGAAFRDQEDMVSTLKDGGVGTMELVAMELKQMGSYIARTLSYQGVSFEQKLVEVDEAYRALYDKAVDLWFETWVFLNGLKDSPGLLLPWKVVSAQYWGGHMRFFRQLCTAAKVPSIEVLAREELSRGHCVVIGMQSTGEARTEAYVKSSGGDDAVFDQFVEPASLILQTILQKNAVKSEEREKLLERSSKLNLPKNPLDDLIERLGGPKAVAEMTGRAKRMVRISENEYKYVSRASETSSLDEINLEEKELFQTGRKLVAVISDAASTGISLQADKSKPNQRLRVHITLELAWSADKTVQQLGRTHRSNQAQPPRYLLVCTDISGESRFASAVAKRLEQLGALTHGDRYAASASDVLAAFNIQTKYGKQALATMYKIILGKQPAPEGITPQWVLEDLSSRGYEPGTPDYDMKRISAMNRFLTEAREELTNMKVLEDEDNAHTPRGNAVDDVLLRLEDADKEKKSHGQGRDINRLLNRLLGIHVEKQKRIFSYFMLVLDSHIKEMKKTGKYDEQGIITPSCSAIQFISKETAFKSAVTGAESYLYKFRTDRGMTWEMVLDKYKKEKAEDPETETCFAYREYYPGGGKIKATNYVLAIERNERGRKRKGAYGKRRSVPAFFRFMRPATGYGAMDTSYEKFKADYKPVTDADVFGKDGGKSSRMRRNWEGEYQHKTRERHQDMYVISGSMLHVLSSISHVFQTGSRTSVSRSNKMQVIRVESTDARPVSAVGVLVPDHLVRELMVALRALQGREAIAAQQDPALQKPVKGQQMRTESHGAVALDNVAKPEQVVIEDDDEEDEEDNGGDSDTAQGGKSTRRRSGGGAGSRKRSKNCSTLRQGPALGEALHGEEGQELSEAIKRLASAGLWEAPLRQLTVRATPAVDKWASKILPSPLPHRPSNKSLKKPELDDFIVLSSEEEDEDDQPLGAKRKAAKVGALAGQSGDKTHNISSKDKKLSSREVEVEDYEDDVAIGRKGIGMRRGKHILADEGVSDESELDEETDEEDIDLSDEEEEEEGGMSDSEVEEELLEEDEDEKEEEENVRWGSRGLRNTPRSRSPSPLGILGQATGGRSQEGTSSRRSLRSLSPAPSPRPSPALTPSLALSPETSPPLSPAPASSLIPTATDDNGRAAEVLTPQPIPSNINVACKRTHQAQMKEISLAQDPKRQRVDHTPVPELMAQDPMVYERGDAVGDAALSLTGNNLTGTVSKDETSDTIASPPCAASLRRESAEEGSGVCKTAQGTAEAGGTGDMERGGEGMSWVPHGSLTLQAETIKGLSVQYGTVMVSEQHAAAMESPQMRQLSSRVEDDISAVPEGPLSFRALVKQEVEQEYKESLKEKIKKAAEIGQRHAEKEIVSLKQALKEVSEKNQQLEQRLTEMTSNVLAAEPAGSHEMMSSGSDEVYAKAKAEVETQYFEHMKEQIMKAAELGKASAEREAAKQVEEKCRAHVLQTAELEKKLLLYNRLAEEAQRKTDAMSKKLREAVESKLKLLEELEGLRERLTLLDPSSSGSAHQVIKGLHEAAGLPHTSGNAAADMSAAGLPHTSGNAAADMSAAGLPHTSGNAAADMSAARTHLPGQQRSVSSPPSPPELKRLICEEVMEGDSPVSGLVERGSSSTAGHVGKVVVGHVTGEDSGNRCIGGQTSISNRHGSGIASPVRRLELNVTPGVSPKPYSSLSFSSPQPLQPNFTADNNFVRKVKPEGRSYSFVHTRPDTMAPATVLKAESPGMRAPEVLNVSCESVTACLSAAGGAGMTAAALAEHFRNGLEACDQADRRRDYCSEEAKNRFHAQLCSCLRKLVLGMDVFRRGGSSSLTDEINLDDDSTVYIIM